MKDRILIVDDNREFLDELGELLRLSGYDMVAVGDAESALKAAVKEKPDAVLLDLKMPGKSGFQLAGELRHIPDMDAVPIIAMSGFFKDIYQPLMNICGIKKCIRKPFTPLDVITAIEEALK